MPATVSVRLARLRSRFVRRVLPKVQLHAQIYFRDVRCPDTKADRIAEACALSWKWFVRLAKRGKDATRFPSAIAGYAVRAVRSGRRVCGQEKAKEVLSPRAQQRHGFTVESLPSATAVSHEHLYGNVRAQQKLDEFEERLQDNTQTPVPDQAAFRIDFPAWLQTLTARERQLIRCMLRNERTKDLSRMFQLSPGRISQLRSEFRDDWQRFTEDESD